MATDSVLLRDSKETNSYKKVEQQPILRIPTEAFSVFLAEVNGSVPKGTNGSLFVSEQDGGDIELSAAGSPVNLRYDADEWQAFCDGVAAGEFGEPDAAR